MTIHTANGPIVPGALGRTLMHEHLLIAVSGWTTDPDHAQFDRHEAVAACVDRVEEMKAAGFTSMLDPCPLDLGRDAALSAEVAARTGFNIIMATGLFNSDSGAAYWRTRALFDPDFVRKTADRFVAELTVGMAGTDIKAGVIKVATGSPAITAYERAVLAAAALASNETGAPITTHTEAILGDQQVEILCGHGVPAQRIIVGHCCGSRDHAYHMGLVDRGAYLGFDRFGYVGIVPDEDRVKALMAIREKGGLSQVMLSTDSVTCGIGLPEAEFNTPLHISRVIVPMLKAAGLPDEDLDMLLIDNPRRYFSDGGGQLHGPRRRVGHGETAG